MGENNIFYLLFSHQHSKKKVQPSITATATTTALSGQKSHNIFYRKVWIITGKLFLLTFDFWSKATERPKKQSQ